MADISITPANVIKGANAQLILGTASGSLTAGMALGFTSTGAYERCDADTDCEGIALCNAATGQPIVLVKKDAALDLGIADSNASKNIYVSATGLTFVESEARVTGKKLITVGNVNSDGTVKLEIINGAITP